MAAEALYEVARAYESLENHPEAIRNYERLVEEFPEHPKAPKAQFQIGNLYFTCFMITVVAGPLTRLSPKTFLTLTKPRKPKRS